MTRQIAGRESSTSAAGRAWRPSPRYRGYITRRSNWSSPHLELSAIKQLDFVTKLPYVNELFTNMIIAVMRKRSIS